MSHAIQPLVMLDLLGTDVTAAERELLLHPAVGGVIFFSRNIEDRTQLCALSSELRRLRPDLLQAIDQEGGRVQRLRDGVVRLPPMRRIGEVFDGSEAQVASYCLGRLMASEVLACGLDISFAPVLDLDYGNSDIIGDRSFGQTTEQVIALASAFIQGMNAAGMAATGKHFPGHGFVAADSHLALPRDERSKEDIFASDIRPFAALAGQLAGVMPAHVVYEQVDAQPAGFSSVWLQQILRRELGFKGVIFSDDLSMAGARAAGDHADGCRAALAAGCDMVLVCNDQSAAIQVVEAVEKLCVAGEVGERVPASRLLGSAGKSMAPHEYYEAEAYARRLLEEN
jgi:beta-N-acetylhexosaminidase